MTGALLRLAAVAASLLALCPEGGAAPSPSPRAPGCAERWHLLAVAWIDLDEKNTPANRLRALAQLPRAGEALPLDCPEYQGTTETVLNRLAVVDRSLKAGDREAVELAFGVRRLFNTEKLQVVHGTEEILGSIAGSLKTRATDVLRAMRAEFGEACPGDLVTWYGYDGGTDAEYERDRGRELARREAGLRKVREPGLRKLRDLCLRKLKGKG